MNADKFMSATDAQRNRMLKREARIVELAIIAETNLSDALYYGAINTGCQRQDMAKSAASRASAEAFRIAQEARQ